MYFIVCITGVWIEELTFTPVKQDRIHYSTLTSTASLFLTKRQKQFNGAKTVFPTNGIIGHC